MNRHLSSLVAVGALMLPAIAQAQNVVNEEPMPTADQGVTTTESKSGDHEGFMLRMSSGFSAIGVGVIPEDSPDVGAVAGGGTLNLKIGTSIVPNLVLHADLMALGASDVRAEVDDGSDDFDGEGFGMGAAGLGVTYFIMPYNLSLTGSLMYGAFELETEQDQVYTTDYLLLGNMGIGKEWAVSQNWGLGVLANLFAGSGKGEDSNDEDFETGFMGASVSFTATYN
jgi:hypothetical protein